MREDDVLRACEEGYDGVVLSNHGGRQLDAALSPLEVLPSARQAVERAGYKVSLLVDGGFRRGSDVFKALGLGADAVLVGRPVLWGLAVNGEGGVTKCRFAVRHAAGRLTRNLSVDVTAGQVVKLDVRFTDADIGMPVR